MSRGGQIWPFRDIGNEAADLAQIDRVVADVVG
jgi:hypothetical protein